MKANDPRHGTYAGAAAHQRLGVPKCVPCKQAAAAYMRERRAASPKARAKDMAQNQAYSAAERALRERHPGEFAELYEQAKAERGL